eukprot:2800334-Alexandrium_andersonii.AAC.1
MAVNADLVNRRLQFINLHWEDGRASCAPLLDGFSWDELDRKCVAGSAESECSDGQRAPVHGNPK